eukprot:CAMPEP_0206313986 /NCGR_PEP_ID=MMETSP0106_2-20121207/14782_1 /ASSEMBLY_ACC=CAM_ASM_000206 /TAXON_ID=81532 /ORGANISM="Acanthoeca-like sp., Strain 10tr" /LENGTH=63 /DNA_ID=CAMNT_0053745323 /DNA_START=180 /DNA_END=371 /DNA_ORIENTATION=+
MDAVQAKATLDASADKVNAKLIATAKHLSDKIDQLESRASSLDRLAEELETVLDAAKSLADKK